MEFEISTNPGAPFAALTKIVKPHVSKAYRLEECAQALDDIAARRAIGRIVLHP